jgi:hypothetical protein
MLRTILPIAILTVIPSFILAQDRAPATAGQRAGYIALPHPRPIPGPPGDGWIWIPPTYRTVYQRVWQPPVYQTVNQSVWIPDRYEWITICPGDVGLDVQNGQWVLIPGHYEIQTMNVEVSPGRWTYVARQQLITPGHWEHRGVIPGPPPMPLPLPQPPHVPGPRSPGLEPFSPLWEWPADSK